MIEDLKKFQRQQPNRNFFGRYESDIPLGNGFSIVSFNNIKSINRFGKTEIEPYSWFAPLGYVAPEFMMAALNLQKDDRVVFRGDQWVDLNVLDFMPVETFYVISSMHRTREAQVFPFARESTGHQKTFIRSGRPKTP